LSYTRVARPQARPCPLPLHCFKSSCHCGSACWALRAGRSRSQAEARAASETHGGSQGNAPQPQGVGDDAHRRERQGGGKHGGEDDAKEGIEHPRGNRNAGRVVDEGEEEVLADVGHRRRR